MVFGVFDHIEMIVLSLKCVHCSKYTKICQNRSWCQRKNITHTYTLVTTSWTNLTCSCSLGFKLPNRDLLGWLIILRWLFCHWSVFYWSKCTKLCQNRSWYQNKTRYYNYNYTSHTFTKTHVLCVHLVPNYGTNYPTWLFPMSVTR